MYFFKRGSRPFTFENTILRYGLGVMATTCTHNLRVVMGSYAQCCPYKASKQQIGQKPTVERQNRMKNCRVMTIQIWGKSVVLAYFG